MVMAGNWTRGCQPRERRAGRLSGGRAGRLGDGPDLVPDDGFLLQQGGGELGEGLPVAGEQVPGRCSCASSRSRRAGGRRLRPEQATGQ